MIPLQPMLSVAAGAFYLFLFYLFLAQNCNLVTVGLYLTLWSLSITPSDAQENDASNDKDNDEHDVSSLAFFAKHRSVNRLLKVSHFFFRTIFVDFDFLVKNRKHNEFFDAPQAYQRSVPD